MGEVISGEIRPSRETMLADARTLLTSYEQKLQATEVVLAANNNAALREQRNQLTKLIRDTKDVITVLEKQ